MKSNLIFGQKKIEILFIVMKQALALVVETNLVYLLINL